MRRSSCALFLCFLVGLSIGLDSCGTIRTMPSLESYGSPKIYSGARLDFHAIMGNESPQKIQGEAAQISVDRSSF